MTKSSSESDLFDLDDDFRDHLATVSSTGKRIWLYPREIKGYFTTMRRYVAWILIGLWVIVPWISWDNQPLMLFNVLDRHFIILGQHFYPQDLMYFGILLLTFFLFIAFFTVTFGRVWCGWACPQTLFMEQIFRRYEYWIEGSAKQQQLLDAQPYNLEKIWKRAAKHSLFILTSVGIGLLVMLYVWGRVPVIGWVMAGPLSNTTFLSFLLVFTAVFYGVFSWAREQVCTAICPYGRLQSVLLNNKSLLVLYNNLRGEPRREKGSHKTDSISTVADTSAKGDCISCGLCVQVCPTGIDIRNGTQLECINCTACIDACDAVMDKIGKPRGLVTLSSHDQLAKVSKPWQPSRRVWVATAAMVVLLLLDAAILWSRSPITITLLRVPGQMYQKGQNDTLTNLYNLQMTNKTNETITLSPSVAGGKVKLVAGQMTLLPQGQVDLTVFIALPKSAVRTNRNNIEMLLKDQEGKVYHQKTTFLAP